jgi:histidinol-phosphatase (PHP family)
MPLPEAFFEKDPIFHGECSPTKEGLKGYFEEIEALKKEYPALTIYKGLEVDYLEGYEPQTTALLNEYGPYLEDGILSIHFVLYEGEYYAIDYLPTLKRLLEKLGAIEAVYELYYQTVRKAIEANLGKHKPKRIGHIELVKRFQKIYPSTYTNSVLFKQIIQKMKEDNYTLDYNTAGLRKDECKGTYVSEAFSKLANAYGIEMIYGSDAHQSKDVGFK